jgi:hypothetical protein
MKKKILISLLAFVSVFISFSFIGKRTDCDSDELYKQTLMKLSSFSLLKDYRIFLKKKKKSDPDPIEMVYYPITLNRGVKYKFFCAQSADYEGKLIISLYTAHNAKLDYLFATNYVKDLDKIYESIEFDAESTINCIIAFSFKDGQEGCGVGVSSFFKK